MPSHARRRGLGRLGLQSGAQFLEVHYPGGAQAMQATLGGQTKMMVEGYNVVAGNVQGGKMRVLGTYPRPGTPEQLLQYINEDRKTWPGVLDKRNIKPE